MTDRERREFKLAARKAAREAVRKGTISRLQRGQFVKQLRDDETVEEMADVCLAQAVECKLIAHAAAAGDGVDWAGVGEGRDWAKFAEFIITVIIPLFIAV